MTKEKALKMAIEVMEEGFGTLECEGMLPHRYQEALQSCKEALAELEETKPKGKVYNGIAYWVGKEPLEGTNLYTSPQPKEWVAPNNEVLDTLWSKATHESVAHNEPFTRYRFTEMLIKHLNMKG